MGSGKWKKEWTFSGIRKAVGDLLGRGELDLGQAKFYTVLRPCVAVEKEVGYMDVDTRGEVWR